MFLEWFFLSRCCVDVFCVFVVVPSMYMPGPVYLVGSGFMLGIPFGSYIQFFL